MSGYVLVMNIFERMHAHAVREVICPEVVMSF